MAIIDGVLDALARLAEAVAAGGNLSALVSAPQARLRRRDELIRTIAAPESQSGRRFDRKKSRRP